MRSFLLGEKTEVRDMPYDAEVEYLESNGTQCVDSGIAPSPDSTVDMTFSSGDSTNAINQVMGSYRYASEAFYLTSRTYAAGVAIYAYYANQTYNKTGITTGFINVVFNGSSHEVSVNGSLIGNFTRSDAAGTGFKSNILFFAVDKNGARTYGKARISSAKVYGDTGLLVRDFIPVRVGSEGFMYDRVSGQLFGNSGTGEFVVGPDKEVA